MVSRLVRYDERKTYRDGGREQETLADFGLVTKQSHLKVHSEPFTELGLYKTAICALSFYILHHLGNSKAFYSVLFTANLIYFYIFL